MRRIATVVGVVAAFCLVAVALSYTQEVPTGAALRTTSVIVTQDQLVSPNYMRAFIPTGSASEKCLVSMNESTVGQMGTVLFCGYRLSSTYGAGVLVTIRYPEPVVWEESPDYSTQLTLWQEGAKYYGQPVLCTAAGLDC